MDSNGVTYTFSSLCFPLFNLSNPKFQLFFKFTNIIEIESNMILFLPCKDRFKNLQKPLKSQRKVGQRLLKILSLTIYKKYLLSKEIPISIVGEQSILPFFSGYG